MYSHVICFVLPQIQNFVRTLWCKCINMSSGAFPCNLCGPWKLSESTPSHHHDQCHLNQLIIINVFLVHLCMRCNFGYGPMYCHSCIQWCTLCVVTHNPAFTFVLYTWFHCSHLVCVYCHSLHNGVLLCIVHRFRSQLQLRLLCQSETSFPATRSLVTFSCASSYSYFPLFLIFLFSSYSSFPQITPTITV